MQIKSKEITLVDPKTLKPNPENMNSHSAEQIKRLCQIISYQGFRNPIVVSNQSGYVNQGHGRLLAALELKMQQVPVIYQDFESPELEYSAMVSDNAIASWSELDLSAINAKLPDLGPDFNIDMLGIQDFVIEPLDKLDPQCDEDEVPDALPEPKVVRGEVYILGNHRLMCGDSTMIDDVERLMNGEKADMIFTDPPYLMSKSGGGLADDRPNWKKYQDNGLADFDPRDFLSILGLINVPTVYIFCSKDLLKSYIQHFEETNRSWNLLVMAKNNPIPLKNNTFLSDTEWLLFSRGENATFNNNLDYDYYRKVFNVSVKSSEYGHPTEKRINCIDRFLLISSNVNGLVLDLFGGSGSTLIACEKTNRKCFMMELDTYYCGVILDRWQKFTGKKAHREDGVAWDEIKNA